MSHQFDTKLAKEDPRLNLCDFYLFKGAPGSTVMAMTVNSESGLSAPDTLHPEALYTVRFELDDDARSNSGISNRVMVKLAEIRIQTFRVRRTVGADALFGDGGDVQVEGESDKCKAKRACLPIPALLQSSSPEMLPGGTRNTSRKRLRILRSR